jgi:hypothetical protein
MPPPPYTSNSQLYADTTHLTEGIDWARRFRRQERFDDDPVRTAEGTRTVILAPHGGGIERGTSELCLAVAGYHPANLPITPPAGVTYDYWMFEGIREGGNADLHVKSRCAAAPSAPCPCTASSRRSPTRPGTRTPRSCSSGGPTTSCGRSWWGR